MPSASPAIHRLSIDDVFNNLHGAVTKPGAVKALASLAEKGELTSKTYGKQVVFVARQDTLPAPSAKEMEALDAEIETLKEGVASQRDLVRQAQTRNIRVFLTTA